MSIERREELLENLQLVVKALEWQETISSKKFMEEYVYLPKTNAVGGGQKVDLRYSPHLYKILETYDQISVGEIWLMFASQMAKTLTLYGIWAKNAMMEAKTCVWMISKEVAIPRYQKEKITDLVNASDEMKLIVQEGLEEQKKSRSKTGIFYHQGAATYLIGSKTSDDKKSVTAKLVLVDEADEMDGLKAIKPLQERTKTFFKYGAKMIVASTKKFKNGAITQGYNTCEQKNILGLYCPHCGELIEIHHRYLMIEELKVWLERKGYEGEYNKDIVAEEYIPEASKNAFYECDRCQKPITSEEKDKQVYENKIEWIVRGKKHKPYSVGFAANSILSFFVPFELMARDYLIASLEENDEERVDALKTFYEGYYNDYFDPKKNELSKSDDILTLGSGLNKGQIPENTVAIYMTIDTQKGHKVKEEDHYWYKIGAFDNKMNFYKIETGKVYSDNEIYQKIHTKYNIGDRVIGIRRVLWDIQGSGEVETLALIHKINSIVGAIYNSEDEKRNYVVYPYRGKDEIQNKTYNIVLEEKQDDRLLTKKYPIIQGNSKRGKDALHNAITRTVKYRKGDEIQSPDRNCFYIDEDEVRDGAKRYKDKTEKGIKIPKASYEKQMTSETYGLLPNSSKKEGWFKTYDGVDNHWWDCGYMMYILKEFDNLEEKVLNMGI